MLAAVQIFPPLYEIYQGNKSPKDYKKLVKYLDNYEWQGQVDDAVNIAVDIVKEYFSEQLESKSLFKYDVRYRHSQISLQEKLRAKLS